MKEQLLASPPAGLTVVVPTRNREQPLLSVVNDLRNQTYSPIEILIVDQSDNSSPAVESLVGSETCRISYHRVSFRNISMARNWGLQHSTYDAVLFVDDDMRCPSDLAERHVAALKRPGVGIVGGAIDEVYRAPDVARQVGYYSSWTATAHRGFACSQSREVDHVAGANFSIRKCVADALGAYDEQLGVPPGLYEETELPVRARRAGYRVWFDAEARVEHHAAESGGQRVARIADYVYVLGRNRSIMIRRHSQWYQWPVALAVSVGMVMAYAARHRDPAVPLRGMLGIREGWLIGRRPPVRTTVFERWAE